MPHAKDGKDAKGLNHGRDRRDGAQTSHPAAPEYVKERRHNRAAGRQRPMLCLKCNSFYYAVANFGGRTEILTSNSLE